MNSKTLKRAVGFVIPAAMLFGFQISDSKADADAAGVLVHPRNITYDLPSFFEVVKPMRHEPLPNKPILVWSLPMPVGIPLVTSRRSGTLRKAVDELKIRGITPTIIPFSEGGVALAQTLKETGQSTYLLLNKDDLLESTAWRDCPIWFETAQAGRPGAMKKWPCLPLVDSKPGAQMVERWLKPYQDAGIKVAGVCFDDEGLPQPSSVVYEAQLSSAKCRERYPSGVLSDLKSFQEYAVNLRATLTRQVMVDPAHRCFAGCWVGNFGDVFSNADGSPVDTNSAAEAIRRCGSDVSMPPLYANYAAPPPPDKQGMRSTAEVADLSYFTMLMKTLAICADNANACKKPLFPYVSQVIFQSPLSQPVIGIGSARWHELLFHVWLRGANGIFIFNLGNPNSKVSPESSFNSVEIARQVYDELLEDREFLDHGQPMTFTMTDLEHGAPVWSGMRLPDRYLIHTYSPTNARQKVEVELEKGLKITLDALPQGVTYRLDAKGAIIH